MHAVTWLATRARGGSGWLKPRVVVGPLMLFSAALGWASGTTSVALHVEMRAGASRRELLVRIESSDGALSRARVKVLGLTKQLAPPGASPWTLSLESDGLWAAPLVVASPSKEPVAWDVWPAGRITAVVAFPDPRVREKLARLRLLAPDGERVQPHDVELSCSVREGDALDCPAPAGRWRARLTVHGFAACFFSKFEVPAAGKASLGRVELRPGASIRGKLEVEEEAITARVRLAPVEPVAGLPAAPASQDPLKVVEARPGSWGRFGFSELGRGSYELAVAVGRCTPLVKRLSLGEGENLDLTDPLPAGCGSELTVRVSRPELVPDSGWDVKVFSIGLVAMGPPVAQGTLKGTDGWHSKPLPSGEYRVWLQDGKETTIGRAEVSLRSPGEILTIPVEGFTVQGRAYLGEQPFACTLTFDNSLSASRRKVETDEGGWFSAFFPRAGRWKVGLAGDTAHPSLHSQNLLEVEIRPGEEVEIHFPDTEVKGTVLSPAGAPVPEAQLTLFPPDFGKLGQVRTDSDGTFSLRGLAPGQWQIQAKKAKASSRMQEVSVVERQTAELVLTLKEEGSVSFRVVSDIGPVAGATVYAVPLGPRPLALLPLPPVVTGGDGTAFLTLPPGSVGVRAYALAPGFSLDRESVIPLPESEEFLELHLRNANGLLRVPMTAVQALVIETPAGRLVPILFLDGEPVPSWVLQAWAWVLGAQRQGDFVILPLAPSGTYHLCTPRMEEGEAILEEMARPNFNLCSTGMLAPGAALSLSLPLRQDDPLVKQPGR